MHWLILKQSHLVITIFVLWALHIFGMFPPQIERTVIAEYELEYLLLEGHCFDRTTEQPPRGLQFTLGTKSQPVEVDTIVMANLVSIMKT